MEAQQEDGHLWPGSGLLPDIKSATSSILDLEPSDFCGGKGLLFTGCPVYGIFAVAAQRGKNTGQRMYFEHYDSANRTGWWWSSCDLLKAGFLPAVSGLGGSPTGSAQPTCPLPLPYNSTFPRGADQLQGSGWFHREAEFWRLITQKRGLDLWRDRIKQPGLLVLFSVYSPAPAALEHNLHSHALLPLLMLLLLPECLSPPARSLWKTPP